MTYYYVRTNGYDCLITDDGEQRYIKLESNDYNFNVGFDGDVEQKAKNTLIELSTWFTPHEPGWEWFEASVEELAGGAEILAEYADFRG